MNPAQPWAFVALVLAAPVIAAYLHRRRRLTRRVPSVLLLRAIAGPARPTRRAWARPRHLVSLALVLLALVTMVLGLADPSEDTAKPRDWVIVLDTSASMGAGDGDTRLGQARAALADAMTAMRPGDRVALVTAGAQTMVRVGLTEDHARVAEIAGELAPEGTSEGMPAALRLADAICRQGPGGSIVLVSDGVGVDVPTTTCPVELLAVGRPGPNAGITALSVREADALGLSEIYVVVTSALGHAAEVELTLRVDDDVVDVLSLDLPAQGDAEKLHRVPLPPGQRISAEITHLADDRLAADDRAAVARHGGTRVSVLLVSETRLSFTAEAFRLHPRVDLRVVGPNDALAPDDRFDLVVLETDYRAGPLPAGGKLVAFGIPPARVGVQSAGEVASPEILRWSFDHPLFRFVDLQGLELPRALALQPSAEQSSIIDGDAGSLAVTGRLDGREFVYVGFVPHESDLVLRVGFVNLVANLVEWAAPAALATDEGREGVLSKIETRIDPPAQVGDTRRSELADVRAPELPAWRLLVAAAMVLLALEWLLPLGLALRDRLRRRLTRAEVGS